MAQARIAMADAWGRTAALRLKDVCQVMRVAFQESRGLCRRLLQ
jgi:hypothetical protein